jgi:hypothetical protein
VKKASTLFSNLLRVAQLDARFNIVPHFTSLKHFSQFSYVKQWTKNEQKLVLRILIPVIAPLLRSKPEVIAYARAIADIVTISQYRAHNSETIRYLEFALYRINKTKVAFAEQRATMDRKEPHMNFPKFYVLSHYLDFIKR